MLVYQVSPAELRRRVDQLVSQNWPELSRGRVKQLAKTGRLLFDGQPVSVGYRCRRTGQLSLDCPDPKQQPIPILRLPLIHEDEAIIVINKPSGIISHARGRYWDEASVASSLRAQLAQDWGETSDRAGLVHRLDRATSGVMVIAKTTNDLKHLQDQFRNRSIRKVYRALVANSDTAAELPDQGQIDRPIARDHSATTKFKVDFRGRPAQTNWLKLSDLDGSKYLMLELQPLTGRTHQLRVHLASLDCPIVGDKLYGGPTASRLALHSYQLDLVHPRSNQQQRFSAPLPDIFNQQARSHGSI